MTDPATGSDECHYCEDAVATDRLRGAPVCVECIEWLESVSGGPDTGTRAVEDTDDSELVDNRETGEPTTEDANPPATVVEGVPDQLASLGQVFIPIPPGEKGTKRPRTEDTLLDPNDSVLGAYLENDHNYGIACRGDVAVLDADEPDDLDELLESLPTTVWQISGSRSSEHHFLLVPGLDEDIPLYDPETGENLGHIKAAEQSYVVGPGSRHPSGNHYGPLRGPDKIATIDADELRELIDPWTVDRTLRRGHDHAHGDACGCEASSGSSGGEPTRLDVYDILSSASYPEETRVEHPYHGSDTGTNFMVNEGGETFRCWRHGATGNALHLIGVKQGVISCGEWVPGGLSTETWYDIFEAARDAGYDHLLRDRDESDHTAVLPDAPSHRAITNGWDWTSDNRGDGLSKQAVRDRTTDAIADLLERCDDALLEALPGAGKSYGAPLAAATTEVPVTIATGRGREEHYEQYAKWSNEHGLTPYILPAFMYDCPCAAGEHGEKWRETVMQWYRAGATPKEIHKYAEDELGHPLPCQTDQRCPYTAKWDFEADDYDVLIGHYTHLHNEKVTTGRAVIVDEFPGNAYETTLSGGTLIRAASTFLEERGDVPYCDWTDLIENRNNEQRRAEALLWFETNGIERDGLEAFTDDGHALAPIAVFTLLASDDLSNGWERARIGDALEGSLGLYNREAGSVSVIRPPEFAHTRNVIGLDGTPTPELWRVALGRRQFNHRKVLADGERSEYIRKALSLKLVRTTDAVKSYAAGESEITERVTLDEDRALLEGIAEIHDQQPALITTKRAWEHVYEPEGVDDLVTDHKHHGNLLGSNELGDCVLGAVIGSRNYGPDYVKKWGAYLGEAVEPNFPGEAEIPLEAGARADYGDVGNKIRTHMTEHETLQAVLRFGRDETVDGAVVYVHTDTLPDWVPIADEGRVITTWSDGMRQVLEVARNRDQWTTAELAAHPDVEIGERQVRDHLSTLAGRGVVICEREGRGFVWQDDGLDTVSDYGDVDFDPIDVTEADREVPEPVRMNVYYRWEFRNSLVESSRSEAADSSSTGEPIDQPMTANGPPPGPHD